MNEIYKKKNVLYRLAYIIFMVLIFFSIIYIIKYYYGMYTAKQESNLLSQFSINDAILIAQEEIEDVPPTPIKTERMLKLEELQIENADIRAWIEIENTNINYPVLQDSDNKYYLNHNYKKNQTISGSIFLDKNYSWDLPSSNLLIYGHNMPNGTMFQNLLQYKNKEFYIKHPTIRFTTNSEDVNYEIMSVFQSKVYYKSEQNVFKYYNFINAENEEEYNEFIENVKKLSFYDTGITAEYGEQLMTLSTCSYHTTDGRFVVVAKKSRI